eukprot:15432157-Alexandrium_andersonii.AAC.1
MRAPDCACGKFAAFLELLLNVAQGALLGDARIAVLSDTDRGAVLADFASARRHVLFTMDVKTAHWQQLPWKLFGVAHPDESEAREAARHALALFAACGDTAEHHWLTLVFLAHDSFGRAQLERFVEGSARLSELAVLLRYACRLRFAPVVERWVESRHSIAGRFFAGASHGSAVHLAYRFAVAAVERALADDPASGDALAAAMAETRTPLACLTRLGFLRHPTI